MPTGTPHGRYERAPTNAQPSPGARPQQRMRCPPTAPQSACSGLTGVAGGGWPQKIARGSPWRASRQQGGIWIPPKSGAATPSTPCSRSTALLQAAPITPSNSPIIPPSALTATAHLKPLAQPTASRHPMFRCDIDSHPDLSRHKPPPAVVATAYSASPPHDADTATTGVRYGADSSSSCCAPPVLFPSALRCCA